MTLNDLECQIHLTVCLVDGTLDVSLLRVSDLTIMHRCSQRGRRESGLEGLATPSCGQLTRCFSAVAELLVLISDEMHATLFRQY